MKTYFAKYLPVEGEIKKGDYYIDNSLGKNTIHLCRATPSEDLNTTDHLCKKVKLFLCSRDIQVGDKIQYLDRGEFIVVREVNDKDNIKEGGINYKQRFIIDLGGYGEQVVFQYMLDMNKCFKVKGEISPAAKWVKEGDEFDEEQIAFAVYEPWEPDNFLDYEEWLESPWHKNIQIKGPCGHFH